MPRGDQGQDAEQHRDREPALAEAAARLREHRLHLLHRIERLGHDEVCAAGELALEAVPLGRGVGRCRVERTGDRVAGRLADR